VGWDQGVDTTEALDFVRQHHRGVLATRRTDGRPQISPVLGTVDDHGRVVVSSWEAARKVRNLRREPYASYCGFTDNFFGDWVQVDGPVEIISLPEAMDPLVAYYRSISGEHPDWDDYRAAMERERRVVLRVTIERAGPDVSG
jgi:PPOX class probable F420-dependent enzyme